MFVNIPNVIYSFIMCGYSFRTDEHKRKYFEGQPLDLMFVFFSVRSCLLHVSIWWIWNVLRFTWCTHITLKGYLQITVVWMHNQSMCMSMTSLTKREEKNPQHNVKSVVCVCLIKKLRIKIQINIIYNVFRLESFTNKQSNFFEIIHRKLQLSNSDRWNNFFAIDC